MLKFSCFLASPKDGLSVHISHNLSICPNIHPLDMDKRITKYFQKWCTSFDTDNDGWIYKLKRLLISFTILMINFRAKQTMLMITENGLHSLIGASSASIGVILTQQGKFREASQSLSEAKHQFNLFLDDEDPKPSLEIISKCNRMESMRDKSYLFLLFFYSNLKFRSE